MGRLYDTLRNRVSFWKERDQIIQDMQIGLYTAAQTMKRLEAHRLPGGRERVHVFSCRNGYAPCHCPFAFDRQDLVPLTEG